MRSISNWIPVLASIAAGACAFDGAGMAPPSITIEPGVELTVDVGDRLELAVFAHYEDGDSQPVHDQGVVWLVEDGNVAEVDEHGRVKGRSIGDTVIEAYYLGDRATAAVQVVDQPRRLRVEAGARDLPAGLDMAHVAILEYEHGDTADVTDQVAWSSTVEGVAAVDDTGRVVAAAPGRTEIVATRLGLVGARELEVKPAVLTYADVTPNGAELVVGQTLALSASGVFSDGNQVDITDSGRWSSSLAEVASVNRGLVTARAPGRVTITVGDDYAYAFVMITVVAGAGEGD